MKSQNYGSQKNEIKSKNYDKIHYELKSQLWQVHYEIKRQFDFLSHISDS